MSQRVHCSRCRREIGFLDVLSLNTQTRRCKACESQVHAFLHGFRTTFLQLTADGVLAPGEWQYLVNGATQNHVDPQEAFAYVRGDALNLVERTLTYAAADGAVNEHEEQHIRALIGALAIPPHQAAPLLQRMERIKFLGHVRSGHLPTVQPSIRLDSDQHCFLEQPAVFHKQTARATVHVNGRLLATSAKLLFLSDKGGTDMLWKSVVRVEEHPNGVYLELTKKAGNGFYTMGDPDIVAAVIDGVIRRDRREVVGSSPLSRVIPPAVRREVWQRDQGKCTECAATDYLEFDHVIPHSKGGASTVGNVQLLCRRCNLKKSDRI